MNKWNLALLGVVGINLAAITVVAYGGLRYNTTESLPVGFYWIDEDETPSVGSIVLLCPDDRDAFSMALERGYISRGACPNGYGQIFKRILAAKNDVLTVDASGVSVNSQRITSSAPVEQDMMNDPLPQFRPLNYKLQEGEFFVMSSYHPLSFDSRYFGLVYSAQIKGVAHKAFGETHE